MQKRGLDVDVVAFSAVILACEKAGEWERALLLFEAVKSRGIQPDAICFGAAVKACAKGRQWERAEALLDDMQSRGLDTSGVLLFGEPARDVLRTHMGKEPEEATDER